MRTRQALGNWSTRANELKQALENSPIPAIQYFGKTVPHGCSPLHVAIDENNATAFTHILQQHNANLNIQNAQSQTPFELAVAKKKLSFVRELARIQSASYNRRITLLPLGHYKLMLNVVWHNNDTSIAIKKILQGIIKNHPETLKARISICAEHGLFIEAWDLMRKLHRLDGSFDPRDGATIITNIDAEIACKLAEATLLDEAFLGLNWPTLTNNHKVQLILCLLHHGKNHDKENFILRRALKLLVDKKSDSLPSLEELISTMNLKFNITIDANNISYRDLAVSLIPNLKKRDIFSFANLRSHVFEKIEYLNNLVNKNKQEDATLQDIVNKDIERQNKIQAEKEAARRAEEEKAAAKRAEEQEKRKAEEVRRAAIQRVHEEKMKVEKAEREREISRITQLVTDFKKVYTALRNGQSSFFKGADFLKTIENDDVNTAWDKIVRHSLENSNTRTTKALSLVNQHPGNINIRNMFLFWQIHTYAYEHSGLFKRTNMMNGLDLPNAVDDPDSRTAKICAALGN